MQGSKGQDEGFGNIALHCKPHFRGSDITSPHFLPPHSLSDHLAKAPNLLPICSKHCCSFCSFSCSESCNERCVAKKTAEFASGQNSGTEQNTSKVLVKRATFMSKVVGVLSFLSTVSKMVQNMYCLLQNCWGCAHWRCY